MTVRQQWMTVGAVVAMLGVGLFTATRYLGGELFPVSVGSSAPQFRAATLTTPALTKTLRDYRGQVVLLNIWATWCVPCRVEMPNLERLHRTFGPRGLNIVAVSVDDPGQQKRILDFAHQLGLTFEILHDASGEIQTQYQTTGVPETFIIGRDGVILRKVIGAARWDADTTLVAQLLSAPSH